MSTNLRHIPKLEYSGLTIVLSHPSRFDLKNDFLLSANGGHYLLQELLWPQGITRYNCDIRLADSFKEPLLPNTKMVLLLGTKAMTLWLPESIVRENKLDNLRGSPYTINGVVHISSYSPQDAIDRQNWESQMNPDMIDWLEAEILKKQDSDPLSAKKRKGLTFRANYRFWLKKDVEKALKILHQYGGVVPNEDAQTKYSIYPSVADACSLLRSAKGKHLYFDMETDIASGRMTCFAFGYDTTQIMVVPIVLPSYQLAYSEFGLCQVLQALAYAINANTLVAYNGACFDFFILAWKYRIPFSHKLYDPIIAHHRCFPMVEKSLGHAMSLWTYETYHKDEAQFAFGNREQAENLWAYCGKDVNGMIKVHKAIDAYAHTIPGLESSIQRAMDSIYPYLLTTLNGIAYRAEKVVQMMAENDRLAMNYLRIIEWFVGEEAWSKLKKKSKKAMPTSNAQCVTYFHDMLGYKIIKRSKKSGKPSLDEKAMLKLKLLHDNPVIDLCIAYRGAIKETGSLKFIPWSIDNRQMLNL